MKLTASEARALMPMTLIDVILTQINVRIEEAAKANSPSVIVGKTLIKDIDDWFNAVKTKSLYEGPATEIANDLMRRGFNVIPFYSEGDGPHPAWRGMEISW